MRHRCLPLLQQIGCCACGSCRSQRRTGGQVCAGCDQHSWMLFRVVGAPWASLGLPSRVDAAGKPARELCQVRSTSARMALAVPAATLQDCPHSDRPQEATLQLSQQADAEVEDTAASESGSRTSSGSDRCVPRSRLHASSALSHAELLHLSTVVRHRIRSIPSLHIPSEPTMMQCQKRLAASHATETDTLAGGAFMTDPLAHVFVLCAQPLQDCSLSHARR